MSLILGIDPGSRVTGYGIVDAAGRSGEYVTSGCIRTSGQGSLPERLNEIFQGVTEIIARYCPQEMALEEIFMARSAGSALKLGQARGAVIIAAAQQGLPVWEYSARTVKQAVVGKGGASKEQVQHMVRILLRLNGLPQEDAADALAIAICHINTQQSLVHISGADAYGRGRLRRDRSRTKD